MDVIIVASMIEITAANNTDIFETLSSTSSPVKAISDTNSDIVNPIPAKIDTSKTSYQVVS